MLLDAPRGSSTGSLHVTDVSPIAKREQDATDTEQTAVTAGQPRGTIGQSIHRAEKPAEITRRRPIWPVVVAAAIILPIAGAGGWLGLRMLSQWRHQQYADQCRQYLKMQDWKRLEEVADIWCRYDPKNAEALIYAAEAAQQQKNYEGAVALLNRIPDDDSRAVAALLARTNLLFGSLNDPIEGAATCERILRIDPSAAEPRQRLIFYYAMTLQRSLMEHHIREAIRLGVDTPEDYVYLIGKDWLVFTNGAELNHHWLESHPDCEPMIVARALHLILTGKSSETGTYIEPAVKIRLRNKMPSGESAETSAAGTEDLGGQLDIGAMQDDSHTHFLERIYDFDIVMAGYLEKYPRNVELLCYFLAKSSTHGDQERVAELLGQAPPEAVSDNRFWRYKGWLHAERGELREAEEALQQALQLHPYDYISRHYLADVLRRSDRFEDVEYVEGLSTEGSELRRILIEMPNAREVPAGVLNRMAYYARFCGDEDVADALSRRVEPLLQPQLQ
jgi:tetratricopeptide (TPR) repeat protein